MGCSYGGELARLGGLADPSEISFNFARIPPRGDERFSNKHVQVAQPSKLG